MNFSQRRNSYEQPINRRQNYDIFERDPFKVQSYNFRYADKPSYPLQNLVNHVRASPAAAQNRFETFFYNANYINSNRKDKENPPVSKFQEIRRRRFLQDGHSPTSQVISGASIAYKTQGAHYSSPLAAYGKLSNNSSNKQNSSSQCRTGAAQSSKLSQLSQSPLLRYGANSEFPCILRPMESISTQTCIRAALQKPHNKLNITSHSVQQQQPLSIRFSGGSSSTTALPAKAPRDYANLRASSSQHNYRATQSTTGLSMYLPKSGCTLSRRNSSSGCHININIKSHDETQSSDKVTIKIESDGNNGHTAINVPSNRNLTLHRRMSLEQRPMPSQTEPHNIKLTNSTGTFNIDRQLPKHLIYRKDKELALGHDRVWKVHNMPIRLDIKPSAQLKQHLPKERLPSMVPLHLKEKLHAVYARKPASNHCGDGETHKIITSCENLLKYSQVKHTPCMKDIHNIRNTSMAKQSEHKLLNTVSLVERLENLGRQSSSRHSLHVEADTKCIDNIRHVASNCSLQSRLKNSTAVASTSLYSNRNAKLPLNVNINVYADKLRLLRV